MDPKEETHTESAVKASSKSSGGDCDGEEGIPEFFDGLSVLVTGATGFLGILLVEKLLRDCPGLKNIYVLVRPKKGKTPSERMKRLFEEPVLARVQNEASKVIVMSGDCMEKDLGLSPEDRAVLVQNVNVVFHCAATVRFDEPLRMAAHINVRGTMAMLRLARQIVDLKAFVHVSTAYSHCTRPYVEERLYETKMSPEQLLSIVDILDDKVLEKTANDLMDPWPNTYTFTKAIAENALIREGKGLPICIIRPSMVINTYREPIPGWLQNINGPIGSVLGSAIGILHVVYLKSSNIVPDIVPGDIVVNGVIVSAWNIARKRHILESKTDSEENHMPVYTCASSARNPITWRKFIELNKTYGINWPSKHCIWYHFTILVSNVYVEKILRIFLHQLPALIVDIFLYCIGRKPMLWSAYIKVHKYLDVTKYFAANEWCFDDKNLLNLSSEIMDKDKEKFPIDVGAFEWEDMSKEIVRGLRLYILKDPLNTLEEGRQKYRKLKILHYSFICVFCLLILQFLWWTLSCFI